MNVSGRRFYKQGTETTEALFEPKFNWAAQNVEFSAKAGTMAEAEGAVSIKDLGVAGTKLTLTRVQSPKGDSFKPAAEFKNANVATKAVVTLNDGALKAPVVEASVVGTDGTSSLGAKVNAETGVRSSPSAPALPERSAHPLFRTSPSPGSFAPARPTHPGALSAATALLA